LQYFGKDVLKGVFMKIDVEIMGESSLPIIDVHLLSMALI
jgi:hypothetical protein